MNNGEDRFGSAFDGNKGENHGDQIKLNQGGDPRNAWSIIVFRLIDEVGGETNVTEQRKLLTMLLEMVESAEKRKMLPYKVLESVLEKFPTEQTVHFGERHKRLVQTHRARQGKYTTRRVEEIMAQAVEEKDIEAQRKLLIPIFDMVEAAWNAKNLPTHVLESFLDKMPQRQHKTFANRLKKLDGEMSRRQQWRAEQELNRRAAKKPAPVVNENPAVKVPEDVTADAASGGGSAESAGCNVVPFTQVETPKATQADFEALERAAGVGPAEAVKPTKKGFFRLS